MNADGQPKQIPLVHLLCCDCVFRVFGLDQWGLFVCAPWAERFETRVASLCRHVSPPILGATLSLRATASLHHHWAVPLIDIPVQSTRMSLRTSFSAHRSRDAASGPDQWNSRFSARVAKISSTFGLGQTIHSHSSGLTPALPQRTTQSEIRLKASQFVQFLRLVLLRFVLRHS